MKRTIRAVAALLLIIVVALVVVVLYIDAIARQAIERGGTYALGVETTLDDADVRLIAGEFGLRGLKVANPEGFNRDHFLTLKEGETAVTAGSLLEPLVELPVLTLSDLDVQLERRTDGANFDVIIANLRRLESGGKPPPDEARKEFVIREVVIRNVSVSVNLITLGGDLSRVNVPIEEIRLKDVGSQSDRGVIMSELTSIIIKAIFASVMRLGSDVLPQEVLDGLGSALEGLTDLGSLGIGVAVGTAEGVIELTGGVAGTVIKVGEEAGKALGGAAEGAGQALEDLGQGLGDLLRGDKKKDDDG